MGLTPDHFNCTDKYFPEELPEVLNEVLSVYMLKGSRRSFNPLAPFTALHRGLDERPRGTVVVPGNDISAWRIAHGQRNRRRGGMTSGDEDYPTTSNIFIKEIPGAH